MHGFPRVFGLYALLLLTPLLVGAGAGFAARRWLGRPLRGVPALLGGLLVPLCLALLLDLRWPVAGPWDVLVESLLLAIAFLGTAHEAFDDRRRVAPGLFSFAVGLTLIEGLARRQPLPASAGLGQFFTAEALNGFPRIFGMCILLLATPLLVGAGAGLAARRRLGRPARGVLALLGGLLIPPCLALLLDLCWPVVGLWDVLLESLLLSIAFVCTAHRAFSDRRQVALAFCSFVAGLLLVEGLAHLRPRPPAAVDEHLGPHLFFTAAVLNGGVSANSELVARETTCRLLYGHGYEGFLSSGSYAGVFLPAALPKRPGTRGRVLDVGDSMVAHYGPPPSQRFTDLLEALEPEYEQVNGGIPGTGPDGYLVAMRAWLRQIDVNMVVFYLFAGNDVQDMDAPHPCTNFQSLFEYEHGGARARYPDGPRLNLRHAPWEWLFHFSPAPYLVRATMDWSRASAYLVAALADPALNSYVAAVEPAEVKERHLEEVLRAAATEARARSIPLVAVVLPRREAIENNWEDERQARILRDAANRAGLPVLFPLAPLRKAFLQGQQLFRSPGDEHFSPAGDAVMARWLAQQLPPFLGQPPGGAAPQAASLRSERPH